MSPARGLIHIDPLAIAQFLVGLHKYSRGLEEEELRRFEDIAQEFLKQGRPDAYELAAKVAPRGASIYARRQRVPQRLATQAVPAPPPVGIPEAAQYVPPPAEMRVPRVSEEPFRATPANIFRYLVSGLIGRPEGVEYVERPSEVKFTLEKLLGIPTHIRRAEYEPAWPTVEPSEEARMERERRRIQLEKERAELEEYLSLSPEDRQKYIRAKYGLEISPAKIQEIDARASSELMIRQAIESMKPGPEWVQRANLLSRFGHIEGKRIEDLTPEEAEAFRTGVGLNAFKEVNGIVRFHNFVESKRGFTSIEEAEAALKKMKIPKGHVGFVKQKGPNEFEIAIVSEKEPVTRLLAAEHEKAIERNIVSDILPVAREEIARAIRGTTKKEQADPRIAERIDAMMMAMGKDVYTGQPNLADVLLRVPDNIRAAVNKVKAKIARAIREGKYTSVSEAYEAESAELREAINQYFGKPAARAEKEPPVRRVGNAIIRKIE